MVNMRELYEYKMTSELSDYQPIRRLRSVISTLLPVNFLFIFFWSYFISTLTMSRIGHIFTQIEKSNNCKYPDFIKKILIQTAFDSTAALRTLNKNSIGQIEQFIDEHIECLNETTYLDEIGQLKTKPFKFLPGHESLILNIPKEVNDHLAKKKQVKSARKSDIPPVEDLKLLFAEQIKKYCAKKNIELASNSLDDFCEIFHANNRIKCLAKCWFCSFKVSCIYDSCWRASNYYKHIVGCARKSLGKSVRHIPPIERAKPDGVLLELQNAL